MMTDKRTQRTRSGSGKQTQAAEAPAAKAGAKDVLKIVQEPGKSRAELLADASLNPVVLGCAAAKPWVEKAMGPLDFNESAVILAHKAAAASSGDLTQAKQMLMAQAATLDAIFNDMAKRAANLIRTEANGQWTFTAGTMEAVTRIAFKAQSQCRATLQTLGELVNPRSVAFIKQAPGSQTNVANGPQQVNNGAVTGPVRAQAGAGTQEMPDGSNKLLEANANERMDLGATATAGRADQDLATVAPLHGAKESGRQG